MVGGREGGIGIVREEGMERWRDERREGSVEAKLNLDIKRTQRGGDV